MQAVRSMPVFDTHKAVKALCHAGFDDTQAEAVVEQINEAVNENVATKTDLDRFATKEDFERFATKEDLERFATRDDLTRFATRDDLERWADKFATKEDVERWADKFATKEDVERWADKFATKEDVERWAGKFATKEDVLKLELRMNEKFDKFTGSLLRYALGIVGLAVALTKALDFVVG